MALIDMSKPLAAPTTAAPVLDVVTTVSPGTALVPANPPSSKYIEDSQMSGEFGNSDISVPFLKIGHKTSKGSDEIEGLIGSFVFADNVLFGKNTPITVAFLRMAKYYMERVDYEDKTIPKKFRTRAEADASGVEYEEHAILDLLIEIAAEKAAEFEEHISLSADGKDYIAARMDVKTRGYRNTVGVLLRDKDGWLKGTFANGKYVMSADKRTDGKNTWYVPLLKAAGPTSKDLRDEVKSRYGIGGV